MKLAFILFIAMVAAASADIWIADEEADHYSWELGTNESIPKTEVIYDQRCNCPVCDD